MTRRAGSVGLERRFVRVADRLGLARPGTTLVVGCSGGLDSTVLLHLLRFAPLDPRPRLVVAHYDHALRPESAADARWVAGLARAWELELREARAPEPPSGEAGARRLRWDFLEAAARDVGAEAVLTAHHADDQAETVLFRALRGTGVRGLRGMAPRTGRRVRPLLGFWRAELEAYADRVPLDFRTDPTNRSERRARNVIRHELLPRAEEAVAPGARRALVRLARNARRHEAALEVLEDALLEGLVEVPSEGVVSVARKALLAYHPAVLARLVRSLARRVGVDLDEAGTRVAVEFTRESESGRVIHLQGGLRLRRDFDRLRWDRIGVETSEAAPPPLPLEIPDGEPGAGEAVVGGRVFRVRWRVDEEPEGGEAAGFDPDTLRFPLRVRPWAPGDRMRFSYGTKKVARVLGEAKVPRELRRRLPLLVDGAGRVLWIPGVARSTDSVPGAGGRTLYIGVENADST